MRRMKGNTVRGMAVSAILLAAMAFGLGVSAQTHYSSNVAIGVKAGGDASQVFFNPSVKQGIKFGATGGVMVRYVEENHFGLIAELNFVQRGWTENFEGAPYHYNRTLNYLELPVMAHIFFGRRGRFFFNAGPQVGLFLGDKVSANFNPADMSTLPDFPYVNRMNSQMTMEISQKFDYGISAGLGGEFNINKRNSLMVEARFYYGLGNIFPSKRTDTFGGSNQMTISLTAGYWFRIK